MLCLPRANVAVRVIKWSSPFMEMEGDEAPSSSSPIDDDDPEENGTRDETGLKMVVVDCPVCLANRMVSASI